MTRALNTMIIQCVPSPLWLGNEICSAAAMWGKSKNIFHNYCNI